MPYRPTQFQSTVIKPYYKDNSFKPLQDTPENALKNTLKENYNQHAPESNYNSDIIVVNIPQL